MNERVATHITLHQKSRVMEIAFSDGHSTGIYSWEYLYELGEKQDQLWSQYLERLKAAGASRE
jgi:DUF971 family protein